MTDRPEPPAAAHVRPATLADVDALCALDARAYPDPAEEHVVWRPRQLESHLRVFPEGQLVAEVDGRLVGAASSLVVSLGRDPHRDHTWHGITDHGMFFNHDPFGDTLYGAAVVVDPAWRRRGVGAALYAARRALCRRLRLRRIVLGGRLHGYAAHHAQDPIPAEEYARRVAAGELHDDVLSFQLAQGFRLEKVIPSYLDDPRSLGWGTFLEWLDPAWRPRHRKPRAIRVSCVQYRMRKVRDFEGFARQVRYYVDVAAGYESDFVVFPELFAAQLMSCQDARSPQEAIRQLTAQAPRIEDLLGELAREFQVAVVGGSHPTQAGDRIENVATLYMPDGTRHRQPKLHITPNERRWWGIEGGSTLRVFDTPKVRVGILICYDVEFPEAARHLTDLGAEVIFVPFCTDDRQAYLRVRYCAQARAVENQVYVALAGNVGNLPDTENMDIQYAKSAVLSPSDFTFARDGVLVEADANVETVITTDLDLEALEEAVNAGSVRQRRDRRPDLFGFEVRGALRAGAAPPAGAGPPPVP